MDKLERLEKKLSKLNLSECKDEKTKKFSFKDRKFVNLSKQSRKKPEYALIQYLRNNRTIKWELCKIISGNIVVINNKGHELNPKDTWVNGKHTWYIIREKDTKPVSLNDKILGHSTDDHRILMKMVLGAVQKKELQKDAKKIGIIIVAVAVMALIGWIIFGG